MTSTPLQRVAVVLALLYPLHLGLVFGEAALNVSLGDLLVLAVLLWALIPTGLPVLPGRVDRLALLFALVALVSLAAPALRPAGSPLYFDLATGVLGIVKLAAGVGWMLAVFVLVLRGGTPVLRSFALATVGSACAWSFWGAWESLAAGIPRPSGPFENPNLFGNYLLLGLGALLVWAATTPQTRSRLPWYGSPLLGFGIVVTGSRGALLGLGLGGLVAMAAYRQALARTLRPVGLVMAAVLLVATCWATWRFWLANEVLVMRFSGLASGTAPNVESRLALWSSAWQSFTSHPVLGIGYQQFPAQYAAASYGDAFVTHNTVLSVAAETGLVGLAVLCALLVSVAGAVRTVAGWHPAVGGCVAFLAATAAQGVFTNVDNFRSLWLVIGALLALAAGAGGRAGTPGRAQGMARA